MDIATALMNNLKAQNPYAAQGVNQANQMADQLQSEPYNDGFSTFLGNMGAGIAAAPSNVSTMQAIGQSLPGALQAMQNKSNEYMGRQKEALALRMTAANTLDAVKKYEEEKKFKEAQLGLQRRKIENSGKMLELTDTHNRNKEQLKLMEIGVKQQLAAQKEKKEGLKEYDPYIKAGHKTQDTLELLNSDIYNDIINNPPSWLQQKFPKVVGVNNNVLAMNKIPEKGRIALTSDQHLNAEQYAAKKNPLVERNVIGELAKKLKEEGIPYEKGKQFLEEATQEIKGLLKDGVPETAIRDESNQWIKKFLSDVGR